MKILFDFIGRNLLSILGLTIFNSIYSIGFIGSSYVFLARESFLLLFLFLLDYYRVEVGIIAKETEYIEFVVLKEYPFLRYRMLFIIVSIGIVVFLTLTDFSEGIPSYAEILFLLSGLLCIVFFVLCLIRLTIIFRNPLLSDFFDIKKSIKHHGVRSFSTASKFAHYCKQCGPFVLAGAFCTDYIGTKIINGNWNTRGYIENYSSKNLTQHGLMARTNGISIAANHFVDYYPHLKPTLLDKDGYVDPMKLALAFKDQKGPIKISPPSDSFLQVEFKHDHSVSLGSSSSNWPKWFKK